MRWSPPHVRRGPSPSSSATRWAASSGDLSDAVRLRIVRDMAREQGELSCSTFDLPVTKSTTTHHFRVLRENGVNQQIYRGTAKLNALRRDDLDALLPGLLDSVLTAAEGQELRLGGAPTP
ncbi:ArsR/SmtB family transcription factor [Streptomyces ficellus]|uniref:ArsR/SmtB family transcription factor n=1 Tax=Streptomyces ficellus TaxID=1977088 RepID=UPI003CC73DC1